MPSENTYNHGPVGAKVFIVGIPLKTNMDTQNVGYVGKGDSF